MNKKVLVIDDDADLGKLLEIILKPLELSVYQVYTGGDGLKQAYAIHPDLVVLDITLPGMDGFEVCARLVEFSNFPIMMLSSHINEKDMLRGLNAGASDFVKKPFSNTELEARVRALLRRSNNQSLPAPSYKTTYIDPILEINLPTKTVKLEGEFVELSRKEYALLAYLVHKQEALVSHNELMREAWGENYSIDRSEISLYIHYLRKKLKESLYGHQYIRTLWGRGYWFEPLKSKGFA